MIKLVKNLMSAALSNSVTYTGSEKYLMKITETAEYRHGNIRYVIDSHKYRQHSNYRIVSVASNPSHVHFMSPASSTTLGENEIRRYQQATPMVQTTQNRIHRCSYYCKLVLFWSLMLTLTQLKLCSSQAYFSGNKPHRAPTSHCRIRLQFTYRITASSLHSPYLFTRMPSNDVSTQLMELTIPKDKRYMCLRDTILEPDEAEMVTSENV